jgi:hypothetical protein
MAVILTCPVVAVILTMYFYWLLHKYCNFSKVWHKLPDGGPNGQKHVGAHKDIF